MIAHLAGHETALEPFGWTGRKAEWIALTCLHSGVFIRAQSSRFLNPHSEQVRRGLHALIAANSTGHWTPKTSATSESPCRRCSCTVCSRSTTCSSIPTAVAADRARENRRV